MRSFLRTLNYLLSYVFHPNPGHAAYGQPAFIALIAICLALVVLSLTIRSWRAGLRNPVTKRLSRSWSMTTFWFGIVGLVLTVARIEQIQFVGMRFLLMLWGLGMLVYVLFQLRQFRARHYKVLPSHQYDDPRNKYIPGKRK